MDSPNATPDSETNPYLAPASPISTPSALTPLHCVSAHGRYCDPSSLGKFLVIALTVHLAVSLVDSLLVYKYILQNFTGITQSSYEAISRISYVTYWICGILFLLWTARIVRNAWASRVSPLFINISPRWAAGFFFVPIASLWYPYKAIQQARKECGMPHSPLYLWWWLTWICSYFPGLFTITDEEMYWLYDITEILYLVAGVLAILVVSRITKHQSRIMTEGVPNPI